MSEGNPPRGRAAHLGPERRRPQVLDAALAIAVESGVPAVTVGAVADRLGVSRPVVYACFADRAAMLTALLRREEQTLLADTLAAVPFSRADAGAETFTHGFEALLRAVAKRPDSWRIAFDATPDPAVAAEFGRARATVAEHIGGQLRPTLEKWGVPDAERALPVLVEHLMSAAEGAVRSLLRDPDRSPAEIAEIVGPAVYRALRPALPARPDRRTRSAS